MNGKMPADNMLYPEINCPKNGTPFIKNTQTHTT